MRRSSIEYVAFFSHIVFRVLTVFLLLITSAATLLDDVYYEINSKVIGNESWQIATIRKVAHPPVNSSKLSLMSVMSFIFRVQSPRWVVRVPFEGLGGEIGAGTRWEGVYFAAYCKSSTWKANFVGEEETFCR